MAHVYNLSYLGGRDLEDSGSRSDQAKVPDMGSINRRIVVQAQLGINMRS
jgi:hypothetical protein